MTTTTRRIKAAQRTGHPLLRQIAGGGHALYRDGRRVFLEASAPAGLREAVAGAQEALTAVVVPHVTDEQRAAVAALLAGLKTVRVTNVAAAAEAVAEIMATDGVLALDTETAVLEEYRGQIRVALTKEGRVAVRQPKDGAAGAALDPRRARVRLVQVYVGGDKVYLFDMTTVPWSALQPMFGRDLTLHNATFDVKMILASGGPEPTGRLWDTMTAMWLINGKRPSMMEAARNLLGIAVPKTLGASDWGGELDADQLAYAALDPVVTHWLWLAQKEQFDEIDENAQQIVDGAIVAVARMELAGMPLDADQHAAMIAGWQRSRNEALAALNTAWDTHHRQLPTNREVAAHLERVLHHVDLNDWPTTAGGALSVSAPTLKAAADGVPGIPELLALRRWEKALSTYGDDLAARVDGGRLYAGFLIAGARTGRASSRSPNLQNMPKRSKELADFRRIFHAPPGRRIVAADYSQIELRAAAELAGDETMRDAFRRGEDVHAAMARNLEPDYDRLPDTERKAARSTAKAANFGLLYGSGVRGFAQYAKTAFGIDLSHDDAADVIGLWKDTYPGIAAWQIEQERVTRASGYVATVGGRRWFWEWQATSADDLGDDVEDWQVEDRLSGYQRNFALNHPVQGTCAEVMWIALAYIDRALRPYDARIVAVVHDEVVVECADDPDTLRAVRRVLITKMTRAWLEFFPSARWRGLVEVGGGETWAEAH